MERPARLALDHSYDLLIRRRRIMLEEIRQCPRVRLWHDVIELRQMLPNLDVGAAIRNAKAPPVIKEGGGGGALLMDFVHYFVIN